MPSRVAAVMASLERLSSDHDRNNLARFGITATNPLGVSMRNLHVVAKQLGRDHDLATALWQTNRYEARLLTALIAEPARLTSKQMDRWCRDFDNWGLCDTLCFHLYDRSPHAWLMIERWHDDDAEFVKRAAFALIASLALHDKKAPDEPFLDAFHFIESAATDNRNFVRKGVSWALRGIGHRNPTLHTAAVALAREMAASTNATTRWIGKDTLRDLMRKR